MGFCMFTVTLYASEFFLEQKLLDVLCGLYLCLNIHIALHFAFVKIFMCFSLREYNILVS